MLGERVGDKALCHIVIPVANHCVATPNCSNATYSVFEAQGFPNQPLPMTFLSLHPTHPHIYTPHTTLAGWSQRSDFFCQDFIFKMTQDKKQRLFTRSSLDIFLEQKPQEYFFSQQYDKDREKIFLKETQEPNYTKEYQKVYNATLATIGIHPKYFN